MIIVYNKKSAYLDETFLLYFILFVEKNILFLLKTTRPFSDLYFELYVSLNRFVQRVACYGNMQFPEKLILIHADKSN